MHKHPTHATQTSPPILPHTHPLYPLTPHIVHFALDKNILCWFEDCTGVWLIYPVPLHWRKLIFFFSSSSYQLQVASRLRVKLCFHVFYMDFFFWLEFVWVFFRMSQSLGAYLCIIPVCLKNAVFILKVCLPFLELKFKKRKKIKCCFHPSQHLNKKKRKCCFLQGIDLLDLFCLLIHIDSWCRHPT